MATLGSRRPTAETVYRRPRADRVADQMTSNALPLSTDNSDALYKALLTQAVSEATGRPLTYGLAVDALFGDLSHTERAAILRLASVQWSAIRLRAAAEAAAVVGYGPMAAQIAAAIEAAGRRITVVEGRGRGRR